MKPNYPFKWRVVRQIIVGVVLQKIAPTNRKGQVKPVFFRKNEIELRQSQ